MTPAKPLKLHYLVPAYNECKYLKATVLRLLATARHDVNVTISDNGSSDGTFEIASELQRVDKRISVVRYDRNLGPTVNFTLLGSMARGEYIQYVGAHDMVDSDYTDKVLGLIERSSTQPDFIVPECWMLDESTSEKSEITPDDRSNRRSSLYYSDSPVVRYLAGMLYWPVNWFNIPIRHGIFTEVFENIKDIGCLNSDHFFVSNLLWLGKPTYLFNTRYFFRTMHPHLRESYNTRLGTYTKGKTPGHYRDRFYWALTYLYHFGRLMTNGSEMSRNQVDSVLYSAVEQLSGFFHGKDRVAARYLLYESIDLMNLGPNPN